MDFDNNLSPIEPKSKWPVFLIFYQVCCYVEHWNQMENYLVTYGFNKDVDLWSLLSGYLYLFVLNSAQSSGKKIIENVTAKNYLKESLSSILCFIIQGKGFSWKGFDPEIYFVVIAYGNLTRLSFLSSRT